MAMPEILGRIYPIAAEITNYAQLFIGQLKIDSRQKIERDFVK